MYDGGGGDGASWLTKEERLASVACLLPAFSGDGYKKRKKEDQFNILKVFIL